MQYELKCMGMLRCLAKKVAVYVCCDRLCNKCFVSFYSYPGRYCDHVATFARSQSMIGRIFNTTISHLHDKYSSHIESFEHPWFSPSHLAAAVGEAGPLRNCIGFLDGTVRGMCRPVYDQQAVYNGHKRKHALKYQGVMLANGLMIMHGPWEGRRHDAYLLAESPLLEQLAALPTMEDGTPYLLYGDLAYPLREQICKPFPENNETTPEQIEFNNLMKPLRLTVEFGFGKIVQNFAFLDFNKNQKLYLQPVAAYYKVGVLLANCHTCLYGSNVTSLFKLTPPTLEEYLSS